MGILPKSVFQMKALKIIPIGVSKNVYKKESMLRNEKNSYRSRSFIINSHLLIILKLLEVAYVLFKCNTATFLLRFNHSTQSRSRILTYILIVIISGNCNIVYTRNWVVLVFILLIHYSQFYLISKQNRDRIPSCMTPSNYFPYQRNFLFLILFLCINANKILQKAFIQTQGTSLASYAV